MKKGMMSFLDEVLLIMYSNSSLTLRCDNFLRKVIFCELNKSLMKIVEWKSLKTLCGGKRDCLKFDEYFFIVNKA